MTIVQVAYDIPEDVFIRLMSGELSRFGSVVRDRTGIITHLKEVGLPKGDQMPDSAAIAAALKQPKILIGLGVAAVVVTAGGIAIWAVNQKKKSIGQPETPESVGEYNASLAAYLEAVHKGNLDVDTLNRLIAALDAVKAAAEGGSFTIEFSVEQSEALITLVADYTRKLAEANSVDVGDLVVSSASVEDNPIIDLRQWLEIQKQALDDAA